MPEAISTLEQQRDALQTQLDSHKTQAQRNQLGQFATPISLAQDILKYAATLVPAGEKLHFFDPAIGTGAFYSALRSTFPGAQIADAAGFEIDPHYGEPAANLWRESGLVIRQADFTQAQASPHFNLVICNPPYVRHHHLKNGDKDRLQRRTEKASGIRMSGLAGLYCHFLGLSHEWMTEGGLAGWLIPSEFMDVNYGQSVKRYLLEKVTLQHIHRFDPNEVQFADALVSSAIVWFRKALPPPDHQVKFTFGGTLFQPKLSREVPASALARESKWTRFPAADIRVNDAMPTLADYFQIKRGLATGDNGYFILAEADIQQHGIPAELLTPILPGPRYLTQDEVTADQAGNPLVEPRLFLLDIRLPEAEVERRYPTAYTYLQVGKAKKLHERYLCCHRAPWYAQENRPPAPIVCTYIGRSDAKNGRPFRFILNNSRATVANVYLAMYPKPRLANAIANDPTLIRRVWSLLNAIGPDALLAEGRVYGGGLHKLEPRELCNVPVPTIAALLNPTEVRAIQNRLIAYS